MDSRRDAGRNRNELNMRKLTLFALAAVTLYGQTRSNIFEVIPKTDLSATGELRFRDKQTTSHYIGFKAPDSISANIVWTAPGSDAVGCLQSDGALNLSFAACGAAAVINGFKVTGKTAVGPPVTICRCLRQGSRRCWKQHAKAEP